MAILGAARHCGAATWRDLASLSGVGFGVARRTVHNLVRAGELEIVGIERTGARGRPPVKVRLPSKDDATLQQLSELLQAWAAT